MSAFRDCSSSLNWTMEFSTEAGQTVTLSMGDCEQLVHSLMHHRLLVVEVEFPKDMAEPPAEAMFSTGDGVAMTFDEDDFITIALPESAMHGVLPQSAWRKNQAEAEKNAKAAAKKAKS